MTILKLIVILGIANLSISLLYQLNCLAGLDLVHIIILVKYPYDVVL